MPSQQELTDRAARLDALRHAMREQGVDALVVPSSDPHLSEYLPPRWKGREWLSGFTGSVGTFIATADTAGVWTDARYWEQAEAELAGSVDGTNAYDVLVDLGVGVRPTPKRRQGKYRFAASCVLRTFEDGVVAALPCAERLAEVERAYADIRVEIHATSGRKLSDELQDGASFRYGIVSLGGRDRAHVLRQFETCQAELGIVLLPVEAKREVAAPARLAALESGVEAEAASRF